MPLLENSQAAERTGLKEFLNEQAMYEDVVSQIHQKLAIKNAMTRANQAIASSKQGSRMGAEDDQASVFS